MSLAENKRNILSTNGKFQYKYGGDDDTQTLAVTRQSSSSGSLSGKEEPQQYQPQQLQFVQNASSSKSQKPQEVFVDQPNKRTVIPTVRDSRLNQTCVNDPSRKLSTSSTTNRRKCESAPNSYQSQQSPDADELDSSSLSRSGIVDEDNVYLQNPNRRQSTKKQSPNKILFIAIVLIALTFFSFSFFNGKSVPSSNSSSRKTQPKNQVPPDQSNDTQSIKNVEIEEAKNEEDSIQAQPSPAITPENLFMMIDYVDYKNLIEHTDISFTELAQYYGDQFHDGKWEDVKAELISYYKSDGYRKIDEVNGDIIISSSIKN